ncbi:MAG: metal-dependent hydrolase [Chthoniobacteraceae bacterium]
MHIPTHILAGWCLANLVPLSPRERLFTMVAATAPDIDGLSLLAGIEAYGKWHHTFGHNALFAIAIASIFATFSTHRPRAFAVYLIAVHLHLVMDYFGSGVGWGIPYGWPISTHAWESRHAWSLSSWQNFIAGVIAIGGTVAIAHWKKRSPFESLAPTIERQLFRHTRPAPNEPAP